MREVAEHNTRELLVTNAEAVVNSVTDTLAGKKQAAQDQAEFVAKLIVDRSIAIDETQRIQDLLVGSLAAEPELSAAVVIRHSDLFSMLVVRDATGRPIPQSADETRGARFRLLLRQGSMASGPIWATST